MKMIRRGSILCLIAYAGICWAASDNSLSIPLPTRTRFPAPHDLMMGHIIAASGPQVLAMNLAKKEMRSKYLPAIETAIWMDSIVWIEGEEVIPGDGLPNDAFGNAAVLDGVTALVSAWNATVDGRLGQGAAYVLTESGGVWSPGARLVADDGVASDRFGTSIALVGTTALIGTPWATVNGNFHQGAVYVFTKSGDTWTQTQKLIAPDGVAFSAFGFSLAFDGTTALIGANGDVGGDRGRGAVYVFEASADANAWALKQKLLADDGVEWDYFGFSVALDDTTALIGAYCATETNGSNPGPGAAYVFNKNSDDLWYQTQRLGAADGVPDDRFGASVALDGTTALIGAYNVAGDDAFEGAVYVFTNAGGTWSQTQKLTESDPGFLDLFGHNIALDGTKALISAAFKTIGNNEFQGAAYMFSEDGGIWSQVQELTAAETVAGSLFGSAVALEGATALIGAEDATSGGNLVPGSAYFYYEHEDVIFEGSFDETP